jgi:hypothetical protein
MTKGSNIVAEEAAGRPLYMMETILRGRRGGRGNAEGRSAFVRSSTVALRAGQMRGLDSRSTESNTLGRSTEQQSDSGARIKERSFRRSSEVGWYRDMSCEAKENEGV